MTGTQNGAFIAGISGVTVANGVGVIVNSSGKLGTVVSSARFKEAIKPMDETSETILRLKPVTFRYKEELDPDKIPQFGLVAEEVEKVNPDLVVRGENGEVMTNPKGSGQSMGKRKAEAPPSSLFFSASRTSPTNSMKGSFSKCLMCLLK